jgi:uncharacterized membrane protein YfcA
MGFSWFKALLVGLVAGFASGLLGIGGGVIVVPGLVLLVGLTQYTAAATSVVTIVMSASAAVIAFGINGNVDWLVAFLVFLGSGTGAWLGAKFQDRIPEFVLSGVFAVVLLGSAVRMWL